jgi:type II secretory pathway pseudopilin PulG
MLLYVYRLFITITYYHRILMGIHLTIDEKAGALTSNSNPLKGPGKMPAQREQGTTLVEVAVAGALLVLALASLYALYGTTIKEAKTGDTAAIAQQNSIARLDQMRNLTWASITNAITLATVLNTPTSSDSSSTISREVITVAPAAVPLPSPAPSPTATPGPGFSVIKTGGSVTITPSPYPNLNAEKLVNVTVTTEWSTAGGSHQRQLSSLFSQWGSAAPKPVASATPSPTP